MCGIAGFIGGGDAECLHSMVKSIQYRGPDNIGYYFNDNVGLGQARLSIIDVNSRSDQPFFSEDKTAAIVYNGEIYNFQEVKKNLIKLNKYKFRTSSDTEVLLYAYLEYGKDCLDHLHGMFAFAIYNFHTKELFLARDRMGKKPLYYHFENKIFVFASEPKALFKHPLVKKELNIDTLNQYLTFDYIPTPRSIYKNIYKLEPSTYLIFKQGKITTKKKYWNIDFSENNIPFNEASERLESLLDNAVEKRLISDVPLGVFLSGGVDSSTVAYFAQKNSVKKIQTFSIGFKEKSYDESNYAKLVAKHLGTEHHEQILTPQKSIDLIPEIIDKMDEPFADPSIIPTYYLSQFTREHVTVALGGDGSDELLAGYPTFISEKYSKLFHSLPSFFLKALKGMSELIPKSDRNISLDFKLKQFFKGFEKDIKHTHTLWLGSFTPKLKEKLLSEQVKAQMTNDHGLDPIDYLSGDVKNEKDFNQILYFYYRTYLLDDILFKVDRASMFNSLEVRAPFLDTHVVEFINSLPKKYKINGTKVKVALKEIMKDKLPVQIVNRPKKGFGIPVSKWIRDDLKKQIMDTLKIKDSFFNAAYIKRLLMEHNSKKQNHRKLIWNLYIFKLWYDQNFSSAY